MSTYTFSGNGGTSPAFSFDVTAPGDGQVFPDCNTPDTAQFFVQDITETADANNAPVNVDITSSNPTLAAQIAAAISFTPSGASFAVAETVPVVVTIANPNVASTAYGTYDIKLAAKETVPTSTGIGVGSGADFQLVLTAAQPQCTDTLAPVLTPVAPNGAEQKLGLVGVSFTAYEPPVGCENGIVSMNYTVKSAAGTDHSSELGDLNENPGLPQPANVLVTATGSFMPEGWSGTDGTVNGTPFSPNFLSGIGTYTLTETASDGNNTGSNTDTFSVDYTVSFTQQLVTGGSHCSTASGSSSSGCQVHLQFDVDRSSTTSDGAFMVDETVVVSLRPSSVQPGQSPEDTNIYVASHTYGCSSPFTNVQIQTITGAACTPAGTSNMYLTNFRRSDFAANAPGTYVADVWFQNVDGGWILEGSSSAATF